MGLGSGYPNCGRGQSAHSGGLEGDTTGAGAALELVKGAGLTGVGGGAGCYQSWVTSGWSR